LALKGTTTGEHNTVMGSGAAYLNTTGTSLVGIGSSALEANSTGSSNVAIGRSALTANTTASNNTVVGHQAGYSGTTAANNVGVGYIALYSLSSGSSNTAIGKDAGAGITSGSNNICLGNGAGNNSSPSGNITSASNLICMGNDSITNAYIRVSWTVTSDARDKTEIAPVIHGLNFVNQLNPVSYKFTNNRTNKTPTGDTHYGFLAQDVLALEGTNPIIIDNKDEEHLKYRGESLVPILVKAIQELKAEFDAYKATHP